MQAADLGVDEKAQLRLAGLPEDRQQYILQKLSEGLEKGEVRNPSAWVANACTKPEALGIDERARELLEQLPKPSREEIIAKLKNTEGVTNPSAWVVKACLKAKHAPPTDYSNASAWAFMGQQFAKGFQTPQMPSWGGKGAGKGFGGGAGFSGGAGFAAAAPSSGPKLDSNAEQLLRSLPAEVRADILMALTQNGSIRNPSAWVAKAAMQAGATPQQPGGSPFAAAEGPAALNLDSQAQELLASLPQADQDEILRKLENESQTGFVRNPSAWVAKAALKAKNGPASAPPKPSSWGGAPSASASRRLLDAEASQLLSQLPGDMQADILRKLEEEVAAGKVRNPSGWVVKSCLNAGVSTNGKGSFAPAKGGKGGGRAGPFR